MHSEAFRHSDHVGEGRVRDSTLKFADPLEAYPGAIGELLMGQAGLRPQLLDRFAECFVARRTRGGPAAGRQGAGSLPLGEPNC